MRRYPLPLPVAVAAVALACLNLSNPLPPTLLVAPVLDSMFVGDTLAARKVSLLDANLQLVNPGPVSWTLVPTTVATIDSLTGKIHGVGKGAALVTAHAAGVTRSALVIVSRRLDMTLLMDTVYVMPTDTITLPLAIEEKGVAPRTLWFDRSSAPGVYTVDTALGVVTAQGAGGPVRYVAHVATRTDTVSDTGAVVVLTLTDTTGQGHFFMTVLGTAIRHEGGPAVALNYRKSNGQLGFRLADSLINGGTTLYDRLYVTLGDSVIATGTFHIDSITPQEAAISISALDPYCRPPRPWAAWQNIPFPGILAYSHSTGTDTTAGQLSITQYAPAVGGGAIISGRYAFKAQRTDLYFDTLGVLAIQGTFVAPLLTWMNPCAL